MEVVNGQKPVYYWSFDDEQILNDKMVGHPLNFENYRVKYSRVDRLSGKALRSDTENGLIVSNALSKVASSGNLSIEFLFRKGDFMFTTFPKPDFRISFGYDVLNVQFNVVRKSKIVKEIWTVPLRGGGISSYSTLTNGDWHHFVFTLSRAGELRIWIDGETDISFFRKIAAFEKLSVIGGDGFRLAAQIDELAYYDLVLQQPAVSRHYTESMKGLSYSFNSDKSHKESPVLGMIQPRTIDTLEFAPGYPNYTVQAADQLKKFPDARYDPDVPMRRNIPWLDIRYLHRELEGPGGKGFGAVNPKRAVDIVGEMAARWNYYVELPCLRLDSSLAEKRYTDASSLESALVRYARRNPQYPTASIIMAIQGKPVHAGFAKAGPYQTAQDLPDRYYLKTQAGTPLVVSGKKWLSPLAPLDIVRFDAATTAFYLRHLTRHLGRPIDFLNENGEMFGHMRPQSLLERDPEVKKHFQRMGLSAQRYNGWFQNRLDTCYRNEILRSLGWENTLFTFYNVSAYNDSYWPDYSMRRSSNMVVGTNHFSTPSFYPARPDNWRRASGPLNGYGVVAEGRVKELALGDFLFAPFVSAGWGLEEGNIRPAQWLGLLKAMVMLGADFFHVGYFNVTGSAGWVNGVGPNDPRGYVYQVAMPSYAQAIASRVRDYVVDGKLVNPQIGLDPKVYSFRLKGDKENHLIMARHWKGKYLIYGSIQPNSNVKGNVATSENTTISLGNVELRFQIRKQGSIYLFDDTGLDPVFYQLDGWHQYEHPYFWTDSLFVEAENLRHTAAVILRTEAKTSHKYDFSSFHTYVILNKGDTIFVKLPRKNTMYNFEMKCRAGREGGHIRVSSGHVTISKVFPSGKDQTQWTNISLNISDLGSLHLSRETQLQIIVDKGTLEIDYFIF